MLLVAPNRALPVMVGPESAAAGAAAGVEAAGADAAAPKLKPVPLAEPPAAGVLLLAGSPNMNGGGDAALAPAAGVLPVAPPDAAAAPEPAPLLNPKLVLLPAAALLAAG